MPYMMILVIRAGIEQHPSWSKGSSGQAWMHLSSTRSGHVIDAFCETAEEGSVQSWWIPFLVHRFMLSAAFGPFKREIVDTDYLSLERSKGGIEHVLVMTDHFSRYAQAFPTKIQTAKTATMVLFDNFIVHKNQWPYSKSVFSTIIGRK